MFDGQPDGNRLSVLPSLATPPGSGDPPRTMAQRAAQAKRTHTCVHRAFYIPRRCPG